MLQVILLQYQRDKNIAQCHQPIARPLYRTGSKDQTALSPEDILCTEYRRQQL